MDIGIGAIIFIVFIIISIAQKIKEQADIARAKRLSPQSKPGEMPEEVQRNIYAEEAPVREATPKAATPTTEPLPPAQVLMEALFGAERVEIEQEEEEEEWMPAPPASRPELARRVPPPPPPMRRQVVARHVESRVRHDPVHRGATTREEGLRFRQEKEERQRQLEAQQRAREAQQRQLEAQQRAREAKTERSRPRKARQVQRTQPTRRRTRERMFRGAHEVRKAIVFAEILGPPKAFQDR